MLIYTCLVPAVSLLILSLVPFVTALSRWNVSSSEFVRLLWTSSIVVDNWLYIDGGEYYQQGASSYSDLILVPTLSIDLSSSWTTSSIIINALNKPEGLGNFKHEALWWIPDISSFVAFGGSPYTTITNSVWALTPDGNGAGTWSEEIFPSDFWKSVTWPCFGSIAASSTTGYTLGGYAQYGNTFGAITGMIALDLGDQGISTNITTAGQYSSSGMSTDGAAQFVPSFGRAGILVLLGGNAPLSSFGTNYKLKDMGSITIYDPSFKLWYSQTTTGDVPAPRSDVCIVGAQSTNSSTFEIFVYGGWTGFFSATENTDSQNVYILTLPAFRWIRVSASTAPRAGSNCQVVNSQMISVGGWDPTGTASYSNVDPWTYGIGVFDLTFLSWGKWFNSSARPYVRSDLVNSFYADNPLYPASWDNPALGAVFANSSATTSSAPISPSTPTSTQISSSPSPSTLTSTQISSSPSAAPIGAIVGGVVGGIAFLVATGAALCWFCFRGRKSKSFQRAFQHQQQTYGNLEPRWISELG